MRLKIQNIFTPSPPPPHTQTQRKTLLYCVKHMLVILVGDGGWIIIIITLSTTSAQDRGQQLPAYLPPPHQVLSHNTKLLCVDSFILLCVCMLGIFDIAIHGQRCQYCGSFIPYVGLCLACKNTTCSRWAFVMFGPLSCFVNNCFKWHLLNYWLYFDQYAGVILICPFFDNCSNGSNSRFSEWKLKKYCLKQWVLKRWYLVCSIT